LNGKLSKFEAEIMSLLSRLLGGAAFVCIGTIAANAALWNRADSLDWQSFKVPEYGTRLEYPAKIFVAAGEAEKGVGQRFESSDGRAVLTVYVRENEDGDTPASYLRKNLRQRVLQYERALDLSLPFQWNETGQSITADVTFRVGLAVPYIVSTWYIHKTKSAHGILW
jgi:hypothetical protein